MGGCCCSSRKPQLHGTPVYYYYPSDSDEHESLTSHNGGLLIDLNLNMSIPDTYRSPPVPIPYNVVLGGTQPTNVEPDLVTGSFKKPVCKNHMGFKSISPKEVEPEFLKSKRITFSTTDENETCPTCLEEYDDENPKITTKCNHHFHLSCILEWMERSNTCPICDQEMIYEALRE